MVGPSPLRRRFDSKLPPIEVPAEHRPHFRVLPIFAGIAIPFSFLLSIPTLTGHWFVRMSQDGVVDSRPNTRILEASLIISLILVALANLCMVMRYAERGVKPMTLCAISFLTVHDAIGIITLVVFGVEHSFVNGFMYGQPFWMALCSTVISIFTNVTLITDYVRTPDFAKQGSGMTLKQRSLVILVIILLVYIAFGALIESYLIDLTFIDALSFVVVSIETVGFGDIHPVNPGSIVFTIFFITFGIISVALTVTSARDALLEGVVSPLQHKLRDIKLRDRNRRIHAQWRRAIRFRLRAGGHTVWVRDTRPRVKNDKDERRILGFYHRLLAKFPRAPGIPHSTSVSSLTPLRRKRLNVEALSTEELESAALEAGAPLEKLIPSYFPPAEQGLETWQNTTSREPWYEEEIPGQYTLAYIRMAWMARMLASSALAVAYGPNAPPLGKLVDQEELADYYGDSDSIEDSMAGYYTGDHTSDRLVPLDATTLSVILKREARTAFKIRFAFALALFIAFWMARSAIFSRTEGWSFGRSVYFCFITFTTVGYGDLSPQTSAGRAIFVAWALIGIATMTILIAVISEASSSRYTHAIRKEIVKSTEAEAPANEGSDSTLATTLEVPSTQDGPSSKRRHTVTFADYTQRDDASQLGGDQTPRRPSSSGSSTTISTASSHRERSPSSSRRRMSTGSMQLRITMIQQIRGLRELVQDAIVVTEAHESSGGSSSGIGNVKHILQDVERRLYTLMAEPMTPGRNSSAGRA